LRQKRTVKSQPKRGNDPSRAGYTGVLLAYSALVFRFPVIGSQVIFAKTAEGRSESGTWRRRQKILRSKCPLYAKSHIGGPVQCEQKGASHIATRSIFDFRFNGRHPLYRPRFKRTRISVFDSDFRLVATPRVWPSSPKEARHRCLR